MVKFAHQISKDAADTAPCNDASRFGGLRIGDLVLDGAAFLAPMAGVTDLAMRRLARKFGAALAFSEMVASDELANGGRDSLLRVQGEGVSPHAVQIAGCEANSMAEAARLLLQQMNPGPQSSEPSLDDGSLDPVLGCMRDDADLMDEIVADDYRRRREDTWREFDL